MRSAGATTALIREKDLPDADLLDRLVRLRSLGGAGLLVSGRPDLAIAAGLAGVHLPANGLPARAVVEKLGDRLVVGRSAHSLEEVEAAAAARAL